MNCSRKENRMTTVTLPTVSPPGVAPWLPCPAGTPWPPAAPSPNSPPTAARWRPCAAASTLPGRRSRRARGRDRVRTRVRGRARFRARVRVRGRAARVPLRARRHDEGFPGLEHVNALADGQHLQLIGDLDVEGVAFPVLLRLRVVSVRRGPDARWWARPGCRTGCCGARPASGCRGPVRRPGCGCCSPRSSRERGLAGAACADGSRRIRHARCTRPARYRCSAVGGAGPRRRPPTGWR